MKPKKIRQREKSGKLDLLKLLQDDPLAGRVCVEERKMGEALCLGHRTARNVNTVMDEIAAE